MVVLTSFTQPTDGIRHRQQNTTVYVNDNNLGKGTLYIAESRLSWIGDVGNGFSIEYPHISLHAVSRDLSAFPQECLFLMLDTPLADEEHNNGEEQEKEDGSDSSRQETTEMRLVPDDRGMLDAMFHAMNACQALHPDPEDSFSDEDFFEDADDEVPVEEADSGLARLRIGNMDGRAHIVGRVGEGEDRVGGILGDRVEGMVEDRVGGILGGIVEDRVGDRVEGILEDSTWVGDRVGDRVEGILEDSTWVVDRVGGRVEGILGDSIWAAGRVGGILAGNTFVGGNILAGGRVVEDRGVAPLEDIRGNMALNTSEGMGEEEDNSMGEEDKGAHILQDDRSFL